MFKYISRMIKFSNARYNIKLRIRAVHFEVVITPSDFVCVLKATEKKVFVIAMKKKKKILSVACGSPEIL